MIRCTIELLPKGDESRKRVIGMVEIANDGTGTPERGNYSVVLKKTPPFPGALRAAWKRGLLQGEDDDAIAARVEGHHRAQRGSYDLLYRALRACGLEARNPAAAPEVKQTMRGPSPEWMKNHVDLVDPPGR